ncbi:uncharacterized protein BDR25DRAFT_304291 [Lindgomyces ingoldianus]|uniref:Uncharacterized protein n=1 Tax=Lindgomyces ingoldianus TaxID=673940 RepID=A0ACB6QSB7_9PLEO|nr:uncharacterized protein BDR25DRAFT_304291 [Lindgomyces ingoldianus]KAF2469899.1 hypothetical protein BDR25DRAFT_304291 [Lindgomyces ingoldianus]
MDLAFGFALIGYGLLKRRWKPKTPISINEPYLLNIPPEIRLVLYDFLFIQERHERACNFLVPLLTCRLIYEEANPLAFTRTNFILPLRRSFAAPPEFYKDGPFLSPPILKLSASKLDLVRNITLLWNFPSLELRSLSRLFSELALSPVHLKQLTFIITDPKCLSPFQYKYSPLFPEIRDFAKYVMEDLPFMQNVEKIVFISPGIDNKKNFQHLFDPEKPAIRVGSDDQGHFVVDVQSKRLGGWKYAVVRAGKEVTKWRLELTHPD